MIFWLFVSHAICDFTFQTESMARGKNRHRKTEPPPGATYQPSWGYWLTAHALIHGGGVALATGRIDLGIAESVCHWLIDFCKCENFYGIHTDQFLHCFCKIIWWRMAI